MNKGRPLTDLERRWSLRALRDTQVASPALCELAVERSRLLSTTPNPYALHAPRGMIAHIALHQRASGITLGHKIYITSRLFDEDGSLPLSLVIHEVAHVAQYLRDGRVGFLARYLKDYARGLARGLDDRDAYLAIPHEIEARATEAYLQAHADDSELKRVRRLYY